HHGVQRRVSHPRDRFACFCNCDLDRQSTEISIGSNSRPLNSVDTYERTRTTTVHMNQFNPSSFGGRFTLPGTSVTVHRMGYGAMQLVGPGVWGPPRDLDAAAAVLREAVGAGVNHIDTSDFYGPHVTNEIIRKTLHPYPDGLVIVTKVGARRGGDKSWIPALSRQGLIDGVHDNLRNLGLEALDVVNLRIGGLVEPAEGSIEEPLTVLAELKRNGFIRHLGLSNVTPRQLAQAQSITEIVCIQNSYNVAHRKDDGFIDDLTKQ